MSDMKKEFLKGLLNAALSSSTDSDDSSQVVERSIPMKKEWRAAKQKLSDATKEFQTQTKKAFSLAEKRKTLHSAFWALVEQDLNIFDQNMRYNKDSDEIEIIAKKDDEDAE